MAKDGTTMPNDAGKQNLIPSVPRPDQVTDDSTDLGAADLASAADNPTDISRVRLMSYLPPSFRSKGLTIDLICVEHTEKQRHRHNG